MNLEFLIVGNALRGIGGGSGAGCFGFAHLGGEGGGRMTDFGNSISGFLELSHPLLVSSIDG